MILKDKFKETLLNDLGDLIAINSSNPPGNELAAAKLVQNRMAALGAICTLQEFSPGRANAVCRFPFSGAGEGPCLIFNSHLDVVPPGESPWAHPPFEPHIAEGRVYGRGACDAKGSVAAMMTAIGLSLQEAKSLRGELIFTAVAAEETGGLGTQFWMKNREKDFRPSMAVVGEPTGLKLFIGHKGVSRRKVSVRGKSAHSSNPLLGRNAIYPIARLALFVAELNQRLSQKKDPLLGSPVASANLIRGGIKDNVIPDYCELHIDRRRIPGEAKDQLDQELNEWVRDMTAGDPSFQCRVEIMGDDKDAVSISPDEPIVRAAAESIYEITGQRVIPQGFVAATDMAFLVYQGNIPTVILGPGRLAQTHVVDEFVEIRQLEEAALIYARLISRVLGTDGSGG